MGYYTNYELYIEEDMSHPQLENIIKKVLQWNKEDDSFLYPFVDYIEGYHESSEKPLLDAYNCVFGFEPYDEATWDNHEKDMLKLSNEFPKTLFKLHGVGEENVDIWDKYFLDGKMQKCYAEFILPPFDITFFSMI